MRADLLVFLLHPCKKIGVEGWTLEFVQGLEAREWDVRKLDVCLPARARACMCTERPKGRGDGEIHMRGEGGRGREGCLRVTLTACIELIEDEFELGGGEVPRARV